MSSSLDQTLNYFFQQEDWKKAFAKRSFARDFNKQTVVRGQAYANREYILDMDYKVYSGHRYDNSVRVTARVKGSRKRPYSTSIALELGPAGKLYIDETCDCPVGFECKHAYAVLTFIKKEMKRMESDPAVFNATSNMASLQPDQKAWLEEVGKLAKKAAKKKPSVNNELWGHNFRVGYYLFKNSYDLQASLGMCKVKYNKGETTPLLIDSRYYPKGTPIKAMLPGDLNMVRQINAIPVSRNTAHRSWLTSDNEAELIEAMIDSNRLFYFYGDRDWYYEQVMTPLSRGDDSQANLAWRMEEDGSQSPIIEFDRKGCEILTLTPSYYIQPETNTTGRFSLPEGVDADMIALWLQGPNLKAEQVPLAVAEQPSLETVAAPQAEVEREAVKIKPTPVLIIRTPKDDVHYCSLELLLYFDYLDELVPYAKKLTENIKTFQVFRKDDGVNTIYDVTRHGSAEKAAHKQLKALTGTVPDFTPEGLDNPFSLSYGLRYEVRPERFLIAEDANTLPEVLEALWIAHNAPILEEQGWKVVRPKDRDDLKILEAEETYAELNETNEGGIDWFQFDSGIVTTDGQHVSLIDMVANYLENHEPLSLEEIEALKPTDFTYTRDEEVGALIKVPAQQFHRLVYNIQDLVKNKGQKIDRVRAATLADDFQLNTTETFKALAELGKKLKSIKEIPSVPKPRNLKADLRSYQQEGFEWLSFLADHQLNGILADDMGLGKTLQTITYLLRQKNKKDGAKLPNLVVAPTSVCPNWENEIKKFAPKLKAVVMYGPERHEHWDKINQYDVVITSYALVVRDEERLKALEFDTIVLDEAQHIKNSKAKVSRSLCEMKSNHRVCLSGTPLENHLGELWSLSRFLMPGLLGDETSFRKHFRTPIEKHADNRAQTALQRKVAPLILRRTKEEVVTELPPKTEIVNKIALGKEQTALYESVRMVMDERVREAISSKGVSQSQIVFLDALLKLRQICCHPQLMKDQKKKSESAKFNFLTQDLLPTLIEEKRKILIFSQFTTMLGLIEDELKSQKITYSKLTGATRKRKEAVEAFQEGDAQVFLISLKAGGTGLNLTAADTVIHYDPWWNPAAENQATDRAHRMGQTKPIFVHRLICEGSIEERIQELQKQKGDLAESLLSGSMKKLKLDEGTLDALLAPIDV